MKTNLSIQLTALFLLALFSLTTVIGFACSIGLDMGFNSTHHNEKVPQTYDSNDSSEDCCAGKVSGFREIEKSVPKTIRIDHPLFQTLLTPSFISLDLLTGTDLVKDVRKFVRNYHPPIPDIRIAIQSFQI